MVVLVDDDEVFRHGLAENLRDDGHQVVEYGSAEELPALHSLAQPTMLITDFLMPGEDGLRLAHRFHAAHPDVPVIILTANWNEHLESAANTHAFLNVHRKPLEYVDFHEIFRRLTGATEQR
jgi:DNA-binding NtrC family response regulator